MNKSSKAALAFLTGAAAGAVAGLLLAPRKGTDTRRNIVKAAKPYGEKAVDAVEKGAARVKDVAGQALNELDQYAGQVFYKAS